MRFARPVAASAGTRTCAPRTKSAKRNQYQIDLLFYYIKIIPDPFLGKSLPPIAGWEMEDPVLIRHRNRTVFDLY
jgi:hypothetical protein